MRQNTTKAFTAHVPADLAVQIDALAARWDRSRDWILNYALAELVEQESERDRLTQQGLASARMGRTVSHERVHAWVQSLNAGKPRPIPQSTDR